MKTKIKRLVCMTIAFVASFMVSVTAFADFIISNETYYGKYFADVKGSPYIEVSENGYVRIFAYRDDAEKAFLRGISYDVVLYVGSSGFVANFNSVVKTHYDGTIIDSDPLEAGIQPDRILGYTASGKLNSISGKITIISKQSGLYYTLS